MAGATLQSVFSLGDDSSDSEDEVEEEELPVARASSAAEKEQPELPPAATLLPPASSLVSTVPLSPQPTATFNACAPVLLPAKPPVPPTLLAAPVDSPVVPHPAHATVLLGSSDDEDEEDRNDDSVEDVEDGVDAIVTAPQARVWLKLSGVSSGAAGRPPAGVRATPRAPVGPRLPALDSYIEVKVSDEEWRVGQISSYSTTQPDTFFFAIADELDWTDSETLQTEWTQWRRLLHRPETLATRHAALFVRLAYAVQTRSDLSRISAAVPEGISRLDHLRPHTTISS